MAALRKIPVIIVFLSVLTLATSIFVAWRVNGVFFSTVNIVELSQHGGVRFSDMQSFRVWRFLTAQLVHVKWPHMLFNVVCLLVMGSWVERRLGGVKTILIWLVAGGLATLISPVLIEAPYDVGTGASQAVLAFAACAGVLMAIHKYWALWPALMIALCTVSAFSLDFSYAGYPKPGHVAAFILGAVLGGVFGRQAAEPHAAK